jgi:hypothetical protein
MESAVERDIRLAGGPVPLHPVDDDVFHRPCRRYPLEDVAPLYACWSSKGEGWAARHWPWVAFAIYHWLFSHEYHRTHNVPDVRPTDVKGLLTRISKNADAITEDLAALQMATNNMVPTASNQAGHIGWLLTFVLLFTKYDFTAEDALTKGFSDAEVGETLLLQMGLLERLTRLSVAAGVAADIAKDDLLARHKSGVDPMLPTLVSRLALIWESLSERTPATGKIAKVDETRPDFIIFVQRIADYALSVGDGRTDRASLPAAPTHDMIATALRASGYGVERKTVSPG